MCRVLRVMLLGLSSLLLPCSVARSQVRNVPTLPDDPEQVEVFLLTVGRGTQLHALFGHSILRVVDRTRRQDHNYNWGMFDYSSPLFPLTFYRGDLDYQLDVMTFSDLLVHYRDYERRSITQDRLQLTPTQKRALVARLVENAKPQNVFYKYFQFRDNCATRIRDHIDAVLGGRVYKYFASRQSPVVFRDHIRRNAAPVWFVALGLDYLSNSMLDRPIGPWDEMFLPSAMRQHLTEVPAYDDQGLRIPGQNLLTDHQTLLEQPEPSFVTNVDDWVALLLGLPVAGACLVLLVARTRFRRPEDLSFVWRLFGLAVTVFGLWSSFWGSLMLLNWCVSYYEELQHNTLLLIMYPIDWLMVVYGLCLLKSGRAIRGKIERWVCGLSLVHLLSFFVLVLAWVFGLIDQGISAQLAGPGFIGCILYATLLAQHQRHKVGG